MPVNSGPIRPVSPFEVNREGAQDPISPFGSYERSVIDKISAHVKNPNNGPLLTQIERELVIDNPDAYFDSLLIVNNPRKTVDAIHDGDTTPDEVARKHRAARAIARRRKSDMFAENLIAATYANDICRTMYRFMVSGTFIPVGGVESPYQGITITGDYVTDLLEGARSSGVVRSSAMPRTIDKIREKFDDSPSAATALIVLAGFNTGKKANLWLRQLFNVSHNLTRVSNNVRENLSAYASTRPDEYKKKFDLEQALVDAIK